MSARERHATSAIARTELRTRLRAIRADARQLLATLVGVLALCFAAATMGYGAVTSFGRALAGGSPPVGQVGIAVLGVLAGGVYLGVASAMNQGSVGRVGPLVRTSTTPRAVVAGRVGGAFLVGSLFVVVPLFVVLVELFVGAGGVLAPTLFLVGLLPVALAGAIAGRAVGSGGKLVGRRLGIGGWAKAVLGLLIIALLFVGTQLATRSLIENPETAMPQTALLPGAPAQAYGALVLAPVGGAVTATGLLVFAAVAATGAVAAVVTVRTEQRLLVTDDGARGATVSSDATVPTPFDRTPSTRLAWRYLLRARRNPSMMGHLFPLLFGGMSMLASVFASPDAAMLIGPGALEVLGVLLAGATYGLNPLGDERDQLPLLLTSARSTAIPLRGRAVAGAAIGLVFVALGFAFDAYLNGVVGSLARAALSVFLVVAAAGTALGFGAALPAFERREYMNVERAHPSLIVLFGYLLGGTVMAGGGLVLASIAAVDGVGLLTGGLGTVYLLVVVGFAVGGYVYAVRRFDGFELDDV
ncbi:hypothetical protein KTS45_06695 [Halomicroarcula limicola]|uniref:Uncharacterized protein n=1 Tax=Haloarcula limicola TaxID=1429915 RepID=A0A8J7YCC1_9EURY|nr:hypothetical protein [Halomicroarcula limicola]MBV0923888.1 hypothetical protein [Halomicroarcula limicola]